MVSKFKEFQRQTIKTLREFDNDITEADLYFAQTLTGYSVAYKPNYPDTSAADFSLHQNLDGTLTLYGNGDALVPTIQEYASFEDFEQKNMELL